jgi:hypothetical protein
MRTLWGLALVVTLVGLAMPVQAQEPAPGRPRLEELRRRVRERVAARIREELNLTPDQMQRLRGTVGTYAGRRRELEASQRRLREALGGQLAPAWPRIRTVCPTHGRADGRPRALAESFRSEQRELARFLDPIQRAKITLLRDRLTNRARELRRRRPFR